jgi:hypothetical protein
MSTFDILGQLDAEYRAGRAMQPGESVHLFLLGVADGFSGKGVAQQLVAECLANVVRLPDAALMLGPIA